MAEYRELVKALRCKRDDCEGCELSFFDKDEGWMCQYAAKDDDAAAAIEALEAEVKRLNMRCADCEYGNSEWPEDPEHTEMPKRGEWIATKYYTWECSVCGKNPTTGMGYVQTRKALYNYCPNCGAKMED